MNPEFAIWLNGILEKLGYVLCIVLAAGVILGVILFIWCAITMQNAEKNPVCFGEPITPNGRAENGCEDCQLEAKCK